ncbi:hypothetical protein [Sphaerisporangium aureirubrum]|uniref:Uncharacterized protein n=1 Tax=Sphaerisporangium aureirubrum TaxID=1544736 RepID=A0ABW1NDL0_9ACTN
MSWLVLAFILAAAVLAPLFGADTRDGRDWKPAATPAHDDDPYASARPRGRLVRFRERRAAVHIPVLGTRRVRTGA